MSCPDEFWIWLQRTLGAGFYADELISHFGDAREVYEAGKNALLASGTISLNAIHKLSAYSPSESADIINSCKQNGWHIITYGSALYPKNLAHIQAFPLVLYVWGDPEVLSSELCMSIVGTRHCTDYSLGVAGGISRSLAEAGITIVSGGAVGVDRASHEAAIDAGGKTVAFLGCGLGYDYLKINGGMRKRIAKHGAVVSEFPPYSPASRVTFPIRNRLISGLSAATIVVEAGEHSGSLITARTALDQGRNVFAVPGDITNTANLGTNSLIRDGAAAVLSIGDVLSDYAKMYPELEEYCVWSPIESYISPNLKEQTEQSAAKKQKETDKEKISNKQTDTPRRQQSFANQMTLDEAVESAEKILSAQPKQKKSKNPVKTKKTDESKQNKQSVQENTKSAFEMPDYASDNAKKVYSYLSAEPQLADKISELSGLSAQDALTALTELELYGACNALSGGRYSK